MVVQCDGSSEKKIELPSTPRSMQRVEPLRRRGNRKEKSPSHGEASHSTPRERRALRTLSLIPFRGRYLLNDAFVVGICRRINPPARRIKPRKRDWWSVNELVQLMKSIWFCINYRIPTPESSLILPRKRSQDDTFAGISENEDHSGGSQTLPYGENTRHFKKCRLLNPRNQGRGALRHLFGRKHSIHCLLYTSRCV